mgnify:CR=1 FL=1
MEIREELLKCGHEFKTNSDSEVLIHGFEEWGEELVAKLRGMFAFVIWDKKTETLFGARDYFGIKPFYYARFGADFLFGSEIKSFLPHPDFKKELNDEALKFYLTFQFHCCDVCRHFWKMQRSFFLAGQSCGQKKSTG